MFLDRDGTIIEDVGYPRDPAAVTVLPGALAALHALRGLGFALVVVSNQSGLARGLVSEAEAKAVHDRFLELCAAGGVRFDAVSYCPHGPEDGCDCRKPAPGMLLAAADRLGIDLTASFMIGDKASDVEAGRRAGCRTIRLSTAEDEQGAGAVASNWSAVYRLISAGTP
ncbi:MAG TPA: HAD family hydrolase [Solirubrobacteraceae bacterium]|nr:HAD family hydrolase [Solirubrobacteraceae bacterium]